jgi:Ca-activated chloride channel family protein
MATERPIPGGELQIVGDAPGACPLKHTTVEADIVGFVSRVHVRQVFQNPLNEKIEAVYVFPLPQHAAVDDMVMTVGERKIIGQIKPRDEARSIYEAARRAGHVAGLLDQERPNIFTQSVANIEAGADVVVEISYVDLLPYEDGSFEFVFPMVVGPRYMPGGTNGKQGTGWSPDTTRVPDASKISPPVAVPGTRAGHDIDITVLIDAGTEIFDLASALHDVKVDRKAAGTVEVSLRHKDELPNRDFVLRYRTATDEIGDSFLVHEDERGRFFTLVLQPPRRVRPEQAVAKEMIFVIDRSGSMSGFPIEKAKEAMRLAIEQMNPNDTFNLLSFAGGTGRCFENPVLNTAENRATALRYLADLHGGGGTEMMQAIEAALGGPKDAERVRIVGFMTDGYIGNDFAVIDAVKKHAGTARVFSFGIGNSVNRFLLDGMARAGRGEAEYVLLESQGDEAVERFHERIHSPVLTDIEIDWGTLPVTDVYPRRFPDLFSVKPLLIHGRLAGPGTGTLTLHGHTADGPFSRTIAVEEAAEEDAHGAVASLWARAAVDDLMQRDLTALQNGQFPKEIEEEITSLGVTFRLMTQFTSFVAVEELTVTVGGEPRTIAVPVDMPDGVDYEGVFGKEELARRSIAVKSFAQAPARESVGQAPSPASGPSGFISSFRSRDHDGIAALHQEADVLGVVDEQDVVEREKKLDSQLLGLADKVAKNGKDGNLRLDSLRVVDHRVEVILYLRDVTPETLAALEKLGFKRNGEAESANVLVGSIAVDKLEELEKLEVVLRIVPVTA